MAGLGDIRWLGQGGGANAVDILCGRHIAERCRDAGLPGRVSLGVRLGERGDRQCRFGERSAQLLCQRGGAGRVQTASDPSSGVVSWGTRGDKECLRSGRNFAFAHLLELGNPLALNEPPRGY
jgi:hypothetical protein